MFANQATTALESIAQFEEMRFLADHDPLTRLCNRLGVHSGAVEPQISRSLRYGTSFRARGL